MALRRGELRDGGQVALPPRLQPLHKGLVRSEHSGVPLHQRCYVPARRDFGGEIAIGRICIAGQETGFLQSGVVRPVGFERRDLFRGNAAMYMGADVLRLGWRRVVDMATDIAVEVFGLDFLDRNDPRIAGHITAPAVYVDYLRHVLRAQEVLRLALAIFAVRIDEQNVLAFRSMLLVHHENAGGDACAVKQAGRQADHRVEPTSSR